MLTQKSFFPTFNVTYIIDQNKNMKNLFYSIFALTLLVSCGDSGDNPSDCEFVGKWCVEDPLNAGECWALGGGIEFRENGEYYFSNTLSFNWQSEDCTIIELFSIQAETKAAEYEVISITENTLRIDTGGVPTDYIREN